MDGVYPAVIKESLACPDVFVIHMDMIKASNAGAFGGHMGC